MNTEAMQRLKARTEQRRALEVLLFKQLAFESKHGIKPHEIKGVRVKRAGHKVISELLMVDGSEVLLNGCDVKEELGQ
tara:strand:- start:293 stop:526 length:234 start_codon:yes stop_codon:yes gene_type:complete